MPSFGQGFNRTRKESKWAIDEQRRLIESLFAPPEEEKVGFTSLPDEILTIIFEYVAGQKKPKVEDAMPRLEALHVGGGGLGGVGGGGGLGGVRGGGLGGVAGLVQLMGAAYNDILGADSRCSYTVGQYYGVRQMYRLANVCRRFYDFLYRSPSKKHLPTVPVNVRITTGSNEVDPYLVEEYNVYLYGGPGKTLVCRHSFPMAFADTIHPGKVNTFLVVNRVVLNDALMDGLMTINVESVEEIYFYDIVDITMENPQQRMMEFLQKVKSKVSFHFSSIIDVSEIFKGELLELIEEGEVKEYSAEDLKKYRKEMAKYRERRNEKRHAVRKLRGRKRSKGLKHKIRVKNYHHMKLKKRLQRQRQHQELRQQLETGSRQVETHFDHCDEHYTDIVRDLLAESLVIKRNRTKYNKKKAERRKAYAKKRLGEMRQEGFEFAGLF